jgi:hypothetical protein
MLVALPILLVLNGCGPKNPLIGAWESEPIMGISSTMEFKSGSVTNGNSIGGISRSQETKVSEYKIEKDKIGVVIAQNDSTTTEWFNIIDENTIEQDLGFLKSRFHRKK